MNDAAALAAADVGVAFARGADVAIHSADVIVHAPRLGALADAVEIARATLRRIRENLALALLYTAIAVPRAAAGIPPSPLGRHRDGSLVPRRHRELAQAPRLGFEIVGPRGGAGMSFLQITIPATLLLTGVLVMLVLRAVRRGEFDDLERPAQRHVFDDRCPERCDDA